MDRDPFDVVVIGSANLDLVVRTSRLPGPGETVVGTGVSEHPGGKGLNQAVAATRAGARTAFIGAVGADDAGALLHSVLRSEGIDDAGLTTLDDVPTGRAVISVDDRGENSIVVVPGANSGVDVPALLPTTRLVLAQLEIPIETVTETFRLARQVGAMTVLNPAPAVELPGSLLQVCDVVIPNEHEADRLGGAFTRRPGSGQTVVITRGGAGVDLLTETGTWHQPPFPVEPVDTTGAGDSFCGAFAARLAAGDSLETAVRWGAAAGALATTRHGAVPSLPTREAIVECLAAD